jgi:murein DD-endopeptidase MepM/ murein hydrolase activator NlpD
MEALAPVAGLVTTVNHPTGVNPIGTMNASPVGLLEIKTKEGVNLLIAHLDNIRVKVGDEVPIGSVIGTISNNGFSGAPHLHIGAYINDEPVLIEFCRISMDNAFKIYSSNEKCLTNKSP